MNLSNLKNVTDSLDNTNPLPVLFIGHGNPMNAIANNAFTNKLAQWGKTFIEKPNAILVISAHWLTNGTHVMISSKPRTIHDFGGFPEVLYKIKYPAPGATDYALEIKQIVRSTSIIDNDQWGLDHGAWSVLRHMFPKADIPVFQLSIDARQPPIYHYNLANELKTLRKKGVLIIGSGNIVHNLYKIDFNENARPFDWAIEFDEIVKSKLRDRDFKSLIDYPSLGRSSSLSVPTNDHYLPMLYSLGLMDKGEQIVFTIEEIQNASISMRSFQVN